MNERWCVYACFDRQERPLYVGMTGSGHRRLRQHGKNREWWPRVDHVRIYHYEDRDECMVREVDLMRWLRPEFNSYRPRSLKRPASWSDKDCEDFARRNPLTILVETS